MSSNPKRRLESKEKRRQPEPERGQCRHCGCTENQPCALWMMGLDMACNLSVGPRTTCAWANKRQTVCTNPGCLEKERSRSAIVVLIKHAARRSRRGGR